MPEYLRAFAVIFVLGACVFFSTRRPIGELIPEEMYTNWRKIWLISTVALFFSHSAWIFMLVMAGILVTYRRRVESVIGLYFLLLFLAPPLSVVVPGMGVVDHLWALDYYQLLGITLLLPAAFVLFQRASTPSIGTSVVDWLVLGYVCLLSILAFRDASMPSAVRAAVASWVNIFLPYYVVSRSFRRVEEIRYAFVGYVIGAMLLSLIALVEVLRSWQLYSAVSLVLHDGQYSLVGGYLYRGDLLRPNATGGQPIVVGYAVVVGLGMFLYLKDLLSRPLYRWLGMSLLVGGVIASLSRGPWVGMMFLLLIFMITGPRPIKQMVQLMILGGLGILILSQVPRGQYLIDLLPIIGESEQGNVEYRANLLTSSLPVIERNFLFGSKDFLDAPELQVMIQGEGIIDIVNSYLEIALKNGVVGLVLFVSAFLCAGVQLRAGIKKAKNEKNAESARMGRALLSTLAAILVIIYTVSSIFAVASVYWAVLGLIVAYVGLMRNENGVFQRSVLMKNETVMPADSTRGIGQNR